MAIYQQLGVADPANRRYQTGISFAHKHVGSVLAVQNQLQPALNHYRAALAIDEKELSLDPGNAQARYNITFTYSDTGWILNRQGDFDGALQYYGKAMKIRSALAAADPNDVRAKEGLSSTYVYLGWTYAKKGDSARALLSYKESLTIRQSLFQKDPANDRLRSKVAESQADIGQAYAALAARAHSRPSEQVRLCREAVTWMQKALPVYQQRKIQGKLAAGEVRMPDTLASEIGKCNRIIDRLGRLDSPRQ